jgi:hypothetical protein
VDKIASEEFRGQKTASFSPSFCSQSHLHALTGTFLKDSPMYILRALAFLFLTQTVLAQRPTPILPDPKLTPGDTFEVTAQDVCVPGYAKKVRAVPAWLKRQAYAEYGITQYKTGDYKVDHLIPYRREDLIPFVIFGPNQPKRRLGTRL